MILIYSDSEVIDREWIPGLAWPDTIEICHSLTDFLQSDCDRKIAFTAHRMHLTWDQPESYKDFEHKVNLLSSASRVVFCIESELHNYHWQIYDQCHAPNVYWCQPGVVNDRPDMTDHVIFWGDWFKTSTAVYKALPDKLAQLQPWIEKSKMFDALLGSPKPHRDYVAHGTQQHSIQDQILLTYGGAWKNTEFYAQNYFVWEPDCVPQQPIIGTADWVSYLGHQCHLSQVIPVEVYNNTCYSIVAETDCDNTLSFYSEKTAKVMIARRLFVAFSGYKFLHNLRGLGFQTFDGVIDESYDLEPDFELRMHQAFQQVKWLCQQPQQRILDQIKPIAEHNHAVIMNTDWTRRALDQCQIKLDMLVN